MVEERDRDRDLEDLDDLRLDFEEELEEETGEGTLGEETLGEE
eukprot:CAMPEP_0184364056 /NCGR_PEP_ID=MMETSP1089-20130417/142469_1 /TAXON_ID=38269 ORGANISM="Gloeochaete wittrockiana, Strain SAG46.84" /NCGR_SAMPLE_ID=MMETSP1089 /ASSEMBLY_ACC=CAM_ASM_000445 /LENGTH=42 /DNA_ID= /DNA_START= /DNA_END= /DNA_ORIENTATION=